MSNGLDKRYLIAAGIVIGGAGYGLVKWSNPPAPAIVPPVIRSAIAPATKPAEQIVIDPPPAIEPAPQIQAPKPAAPPIATARPAAKKSVAAAPNPPAPEPDKPIERQALIYVGADPAAEAVWMNAINDPSISAHDRQDLIEDLNEEGFDDPKNPTADDLPLIENRLALIESLAPSAMDDVNAAAFAEAYKDLIHMHSRAAGQ